MVWKTDDRDWPEETAIGPYYCTTCGHTHLVNPGDGCEHYEDNQVTHPNHYTWIEGIECKDVVKRMEWAIGNAVKYLWRCNHKGNREQDIKKAMECCKIALTTKGEEG